MKNDETGLEVIATHLGADFDAFSSTLAARKLHPGAVLFFPGSREESVRRMIEERGVELDETRQKELDPSRIRRLVLCDIRQRDRIGVLAQWLDEHPEIEVLAYDHHPDATDDVEITGGIVDPGVGATCTLLVEELRRREIEVTPEEATLFLMGIYEDTGSLAYGTTDRRDLEAAGWLLERGGDLSAVRRYAVHSLDAPHVEVLYRMTQELRVFSIRGHRVGIVVLELGEYVPELAPLVSTCVEIFDLPLLFGVFGEGDRVTIIARGDLEDYDLGAALEALDAGGGHPTAAAGSLKGLTALETQERLLDHLEATLPAVGTAADLMTSPCVGVDAEETVEAAKERLVRSRINAAPVMSDERAIGAVTRQILDAALQHGMGDRPVTRVMERGLEWVPPEAPASELGRRILEQHPRFVLVGDPQAGVPFGIVTRMTVLRHLHARLEQEGERIERRSRACPDRRRDVSDLVAERLPAELFDLLERVAAVARRGDHRAYLVGGFVRDLLLGRENADLDFVVEGDGPLFARELGEELDARVRVHEAFMTATVVAPDLPAIDVATARSEYYEAPAALPEVQMSPLRQDLYRRDFTINTLAIRIGPEPGYELIDYFGGQRDLEEGILRVLHSLSFIDDPTRALRAVRLETKLGFEISEETLRLVELALAEGVFDRLSGSRLRDELRRLLGDPHTALRGLERLAEIGVLRVVHPALVLDDRRLSNLRDARAAFEWYELEELDEPPVEFARLAFLALALGMEVSECRELADRLDLVGEERRELVEVGERVESACATLAEADVRPHRVRRALAALTGEEVLLVMGIGGEDVRAWVRRDLEVLRHLELEIGGQDLLRAGYEEGPAIGAALGATLDARLDGELGREEELEYALSVLEKETESE